MLGRDAHPVVDHADLSNVLVDCDRQEDRLARWRVLDRIGDQVVEKLREPRLPDRDAHRLDRSIEVDPSTPNTRAGDGLPRLGRGIHRPLVTRLLLRAQKVGHQALELSELALYRLQVP